jgi:hypothetical protein
MRKAVFLLFAVSFLLFSCGGNSNLEKSLYGSVWIEDYRVRDVYVPMAGRTRPAIVLNHLIFGNKGDASEGRLKFVDDYNEYDDYVGNEYEIGKKGIFTLFLYPKSEVLAVKNKQPSEWPSLKGRFVIEGQFEKDTLTLPSRLQTKDGERVYKKSSQEELKKIFDTLMAEFEEKEAVYDQEMREYRERFN